MLPSSGGLTHKQSASRSLPFFPTAEFQSVRLPPYLPPPSNRHPPCSSLDTSCRTCYPELGSDAREVS
nr:MAG TPA: hypothetical protein [Caudoviricetes sp.]